MKYFLSSIAFLIGVMQMQQAHCDDRGIEKFGVERELFSFKRCSTPEPKKLTSAELKLQNERLKGFRQRNSHKLQKMKDDSVEISTHVFAFNDGTLGIVSEDVMEKQMKVLNDAFSAKPSLYPECGGIFNYVDAPETPFRFVLKTFENIENVTAFDLESFVSGAKRRELRKGNCADLNIFIGDSEFLGGSNFPEDCDPDDSVLLNFGSLPEGFIDNYNQGDTLVHEIGHWLGLYHTFEGGCEDRDLVDDTPAEAEPAYQCPVQKDSCAVGKADPIHNYMDYSDDCCMYRFTSGQIDRMLEQVFLYRGLGDAPPTPSPTPPPNGSGTCGFPADGFNYSSCEVDKPCWVGDNICDSYSGNYDTADCNFDGGDCDTGPSDSGCVFPDDGFDYSSCDVTFPCFVGDGTCDEVSVPTDDYYISQIQDDFILGLLDDVYNSPECNFDGQDCVCEFPRDGFDYSNCKVDFKCRIGDGICQSGKYASSACNNDGGDCVCNYPNDGFDYSNCDATPCSYLGDGHCDLLLENFYTPECNWDGLDCDVLQDCEFPSDDFDYTECNVDYPCFIGDGYCDDYFEDFFTAECNWDGGDCGPPPSDCSFPSDDFDYTSCNVEFPCKIGDGKCDALGGYLTDECNNDGGDCCSYPTDNFDYSGCNALKPCWIGDGICNVEYNTEECNFDRGDCNICAFPQDGFDYSRCTTGYPCWIGDNHCDQLFYTEECNWDKGDCGPAPSETDCPFPDDGFDYSRCEVDRPCLIGDGNCDTEGNYNTALCNNDGRDCGCRFPRDGFDYSQCDAYIPCRIGDGKCHENLNTVECNFDAGDCKCSFPNDGFDYSGCNVAMPCMIGNKRCDNHLSDYMKAECNWDGRDCDISFGSPTAQPANLPPIEPSQAPTMEDTRTISPGDGGDDILQIIADFINAIISFIFDLLGLN